MTHYMFDVNDGTIATTDDVYEWAAWMETANRTIGRDTIEVDGILVNVSTVFLGIDHSFGFGQPVLFETMIFGGKHDQYQERYCTLEEAKIGHLLAIEMARHLPS